MFKRCTTIKSEKTQNKKDEYTYYKQNAFIKPAAYKTNLQQSHNSNFAV